MKANTQTTVHAALDAAHAYGDRIAELRKVYAGKTADEVRTAILPCVASYSKYQVPVVKGEGKAEGTKVLDKTHAKYEACRKALGRLVNDIMGKSSGATEPAEEIEVPEEILKAAERLAKLCAEYEGARKLASTAIAQAFAK
jgi:hypothetical protein